MKNRICVSIIMPVYKTENYVEDTIKSVLNQTYENIELICVNDGTPDNAFDICRKWGEKHNNIVLLDYGTNHGLEYARNYGIEHAKGDYIAFLDSDDMIAPEMIACLVELAEMHNSEISMCTYSRIIDNKDLPELADKSICTGAFSRIEFCSNMLSKFSWPIISCVGTKIYKTNFIKNNNIRFDRNFKYNEDGAFILKCIQSCQSVAFVNEPYYKYYIRESGSIMTSYRPKMFSSIVKVNELLKGILKENDMFEKNKEYYYRKLFFVMVDSLRNEKRFGSFESYRNAFQEIYTYSDFDNMVLALSKSEVLSLKHKAVLWLIYRKRVIALFGLMQLF